MLVDLTDEACTGKELEHNLDEVHITANKNTVPAKAQPVRDKRRAPGHPGRDKRAAWAPAEMEIIAGCIADCIFDFEAKKDDVAAAWPTLSSGSRCTNKQQKEEANE